MRNTLSVPIERVLRFGIWLLELIGIVKRVDPDDDDYDPARAADDVIAICIVMMVLPGLVALLLVFLVVVFI